MGVRRRVTAIAVDALPPGLVEGWLAAGYLPNLQRLRQAGAWGALSNPERYVYENSWLPFLQGMSVRATGQWGLQSFAPDTYRAEEPAAYDLTAFPPFYASCTDRRVAVFDAPLARPVEPVNGIQVLGWGAEANQSLRVSSPPALMREILDRHGVHPLYSGAGIRTLDKGVASEVLSFRNPSIYDRPALLDLRDRIVAGVRQRTCIIRDLASREPWDLLLAVYAESHIAGHLFWHLGLPHPLDGIVEWRPEDGNPLLEVVRAIDGAVGDIGATVPQDGCLVVFSLHGMQADDPNLPSALFLPEFLFRWQWGEPALAPSDPTAPPPAPANHYRLHWKDEVWRLRTPLAERLLESPSEQERAGDPLDWNPLNWYRRLWPRMRAFALPSYSHGMVRINVEGRESHGMVGRSDYASVCDALAEALLKLVDARTGTPMVREVIRTRAAPEEAGSPAIPADLIVVWKEGRPADMVDSPDVGRIGPVPFFRSGGHTPRGFCIAAGPGIPAGSVLPEGAGVLDLTATLMDLLGEPIPRHYEGHPWWPG